MDYLIHQLINKTKCKEILEEILLEESSWEDGKKTAGSHASLVKNNLQLNKESTTAINNSNEILTLIQSDQLIKSYSLPKRIHGLMFTRASIGQGYGIHIDNPYMKTGRSDLSFTIFLNDSDEYEGGELCIQTMQESKEVKLNSGQIFLYPSTSLHSVKKVSKGERVVCVGWIHSYVSRSEDRSILFGLDAGAKGILAKTGSSPELDLIFQAYGNILRRLGE